MRRFLSILLLFWSINAQAIDAFLTTGKGSFVFTEYTPLKDKPITVYYYIPTSGDINTMPILFVMHGAERSAGYYVDSWRQFAKKDEFILIVPEYSKELYSENDYQFGGVYESRKKKIIKPREQWTYNSIEAIFDYVKKQTGNTSATYDMWGHSAGGQFTHRFVLDMPNARLGIAVASNSGSWTLPLIDGLKDSLGNTYGWPYSVKDSPFANQEAIKKYLAKRLIIHVGSADTATSGPHVPVGKGALTQGPYRFERGKNMYKMGKELAKSLNTPFGWQQVIVEDIGHSGRGMVYGTSAEINGKKTYSTDVITKTGAYYLIFGKYKK